MSENERGGRINRSDLGSWITGPPQHHAQDYPGERLGRPQSGPGSIGRWGRRIVALVIDWGIAMGLSALFFKGDAVANLIIFLAMQLVAVGLFGHSIGHRLLGMQVQKLDGKPVRPLDALVRTLLLALVIPPFVTDPDQRGLHDRARGTVLVMIR